MKQTLLIILLSAPLLGHLTYPTQNSIYGSQQGLFIPQISQVQAVSNTSGNGSSVLYTLFCKAVCMLYVPKNETCGLNNQVYFNDCQARCDRVGTDQNRLMFNKKCCCNPGSEYIDSQWISNTAGTSSASTNVSSSFCVHTSTSTNTVSGGINVFAIPPCLKTCLDIDSVADLKFLDTTRTFTAGCEDGH